MSYELSLHAVRYDHCTRRQSTFLVADSNPALADAQPQSLATTKHVRRSAQRLMLLRSVISDHAKEQ